MCAGSAWHGAHHPRARRGAVTIPGGVRNPGHDRFRHVTTDAQDPPEVRMGFTIGGTREMRAPAHVAAAARPAALRTAPRWRSSPDCGAGTWCRARVPRRRVLLRQGGLPGTGRAPARPGGGGAGGRHARRGDRVLRDGSLGAAVLLVGRAFDIARRRAGRWPPRPDPPGAHGAAAGPGRRHEGRAHCFVARRGRRAPRPALPHGLGRRVPRPARALGAGAYVSRPRPRTARA